MSRRFDEEASASSGIGSRVIYQHPLAYLLGLEGIALLRAFAGEYDREFTLARIEKIRALLDAADELGGGVEETPMSMQEGYAQWVPWYDEPGNELLEVEEPVVREILDALHVGVALDAPECGLQPRYRRSYVWVDEHRSDGGGRRRTIRQHGGDSNGRRAQGTLAHGNRAHGTPHGQTCASLSALPGAWPGALTLTESHPLHRV